MLSILSSLAQSESHSISTNERWGILRRFADGTYLSPAPYGYKNVDRKMVPVADQAKVVKRIFDGVLNGKSTIEVAKELNADNIPTKKGGKWISGGIRDVVRNETYTGSLILQKTYTDDNYNRHTNNGERNMYRVNDHHEPIVSREVFDAANRIMTRNGAEKGNARGNGKRQNRYPMSGKIICGECGSTWKRIGVIGKTRLACTRHIKDKGSCSQMPVKEESVEAAFSTMLNKLTFARDLILIPYKRMLTGGFSQGSAGRIPEIDRLLRANEARRKQIASFYSQKLLDSDTFGRENAELLKEKTKLLEEKKELSEDSSFDTLEELEKLLRYTGKGRMLTEFDGELFTEFVDKVIVYGRTEIGFVMKCGPTFREVI